MATLTSHPTGLRESNLFDELFLDYTDQKNTVADLYQYAPNAEGIKEFIQQNVVVTYNRPLLVSELHRQNSTLKLSVVSKKNIDALSSNNTYTITTGHQLCLFTGPLYFVYKILSTIDYCEELNRFIPDKHFVPVYWMATEDHDIEEINHAVVFGKKMTWNTEEKGKAGRISTTGIDVIINELENLLGTGESAQSLIALFKAAYLNHKNMADATRYLVNELFGEFGLVIIDADTVALKKEFISEIKEDLFENKAEKEVLNTIQLLSAKGYKTQVSPRKINCFYAVKGMRERLEKVDAHYKVLNSAIAFTKDELEKELHEHPERFSPNVVLRPLYQQKILPNVAYVGGPGELAYWLEYKNMFAAFNLPFPVLLPRNFVLYIDKNNGGKIKKLGIDFNDLFLETDALIKKQLQNKNEGPDFKIPREKITAVFNQLKAEVEQIDKTLVAAVDAEKQKNINGLNLIEQKLIKALKNKNEVEINQIKNLKEKFFPNNSPQERVDNFSSYYMANTNFIRDIKNIISRSPFVSRLDLVIEEVM